MGSTIYEYMQNAYQGISNCVEDSSNYIKEIPPVKEAITFGQSRYVNLADAVQCASSYVSGVDGLKQVAILLSSASKLANIIDKQGLLPVDLPVYPGIEEHMDTLCKVTSIKSLTCKINGFVSGEAFKNGLSLHLLSKVLLTAYDVLGFTFLLERCGVITQECAKMVVYQLPNGYDFNLKDTQAALGATGWLIHGAIIASKIYNADSSKTDEWKQEQYLNGISDVVRSIAIGLMTQKDNPWLVGTQLTASCVGFGLAFAYYNMQRNN